MFSRFILSAFLGLSSLGIATHLSAASNEKTVSSQSSQAENSVAASISNYWLRNHSEQPPRIVNTLMAQMIPASSCVTYAGPVCPLKVLLPVGAQCACYYPDGWLSGIAR